jgi:hypothetical protein
MALLHRLLMQSIDSPLLNKVAITTKACLCGENHK